MIPKDNYKHEIYFFWLVNEICIKSAKKGAPKYTRCIQWQPAINMKYINKSMQINQAQTLKYQKKQMLNVVPKYSYKHEAADHPLVHGPRVISIWNLDVKNIFCTYVCNRWFMHLLCTKFTWRLSNELMNNYPTINFFITYQKIKNKN